MITRRYCARNLAGAAVAVLGASSSAAAQTVETLGTRALGMGGAFVAVADDATAPYWNPAGLATGAVFSLVVERQTIELQPDDEADVERGESASGLIVSLGTMPLGLTYYRLRSTHVQAPSPTSAERDAITGTLITHHTAVTLLQSVGDLLVVATSLKYVRGIAARRSVPNVRPIDTLLAEAESLVGKASNALDLDVGLMLWLPGSRVGLVARNLREPAFETPEGQELSLERQVRAGLALFPAQGFVVSADVDLTENHTPVGARRELAVGLERWLGRRVAFRGGFRVNLQGDTAPVGAIGASVALRSSLWVDAQVTRGAEDSERGWGAGIRVAF